MRTFTMIFILFMLTAQSFAWDDRCGRRPPMRFMHEPAQAYTITVLDWDTLQERCSNGFAMRTVWACAYAEKNEIYILDELPSERMRECIIKHEKAHLNGWSYFHEIR